jgi:hypothetical protein
MRWDDMILYVILLLYRYHNEECWFYSFLINTILIDKNKITDSFIIVIDNGILEWWWYIRVIDNGILEWWIMFIIRVIMVY